MNKFSAFLSEQDDRASQYSLCLYRFLIRDSANLCAFIQSNGRVQSNISTSDLAEVLKQYFQILLRRYNLIFNSLIVFEEDPFEYEPILEQLSTLSHHFVSCVKRLRLETTESSDMKSFPNEFCLVSVQLLRKSVMATKTLIGMNLYYRWILVKRIWMAYPNFRRPLAQIHAILVGNRLLFNR